MKNKEMNKLFKKIYGQTTNRKETKQKHRFNRL